MSNLLHTVLNPYTLLKRIQTEVPNLVQRNQACSFQENLSHSNWANTRGQLLQRNKAT